MTVRQKPDTLDRTLFEKTAIVLSKLNCFVQALLAIAAGLFHLLAMTRSTALESYMYGNPEAVYEANQARAKRQAQSAEQVTKRPILTLKRKSSEWSEARKRAEELFHPAADRS